MGNQQSLNVDLAERLEDYFKPLGICAFTNCCGTCTDNYADGMADNDFLYREKGIQFIRFSLEGMNYNPRPEAAYVSYSGYKWLMQNWESESKLLDKFAEIIGVKCTYEKPVDKNTTIILKFEHPLQLEEPPDSSSESPPPFPRKQTLKHARKQPVRRSKRIARQTSS